MEPMRRRQFVSLPAGLLGAGVPLACAQAAPAAPEPPPASLEEALDPVAPGLEKWAVVAVRRQGAGHEGWEWHDYRQTADRSDFWPASTIKLHAAIGALERLNELEMPLDSVAIFEHREDGRWVLDCARGMREMLSEVFRRSSNEDYTLLLRLTGIDWLNTQLLSAERGFARTALMRGYVLGRPYGYVREEPQRVTLRSADGSRTRVIEHVWSGRSYSEEKGATVIDARTGNVSTPRELAHCLRRVLHHEESPDRFRLSDEQVAFLRRGGGGLCGLEVRTEASGASAWKGGLDEVFPQARFFHKSGLISNYALELAAVDDSEATGLQIILVPVVNAGIGTQPAGGEALVGQMARRIGLWLKGR